MVIIKNVDTCVVFGFHSYGICKKMLFPFMGDKAQAISEQPSYHERQFRLPDGLSKPLS